MLNLAGPFDHATPLLKSERHEEALVQDSIATALDPAVQLVEVTRGGALRDLKRYDEAIDAFRTFEKSAGQPSWGLAVTYGRMGRRDEALKIIHALEERRKTHWIDADFLAMAYAAIGDNDRAITWIETAVREKSYTARALLNWDFPLFRPLRDDPRFIALKTRVLATRLTSSG